MTRRAFLRAAALAGGMAFGLYSEQPLIAQSDQHGNELPFGSQRKADTMNVRTANAGDISQIVALCEAEGRRYAAGYAHYYAVAADYAEKKQQVVAQLLTDTNAIVFVHEAGGLMDGLLLGRLVDAPPVYNPGGKVCLIEDFLVVQPADWPHVGAALAAAANERVRQLGGVLLIVESMHAATAKRDLLFSAGFSIAADFLCRDIDLAKPKQPLEGIIEPATTTDIPAIVDLCERRRMQYQKYQPVFWRKATDSAKQQSGYLSWLMSAQKHIVLVHRSGTAMDGFIVADPLASSPFYDRGGTSCNVDDFTVSEEDKWPIGAWLLYTATAKAKSQGAVCSQVVCGDADLSKRRMLEDMGYQIGHEWLVRSTTAPAHA